MCTDCGCNNVDSAVLHVAEEAHEHHHHKHHQHHHEHHHHPDSVRGNSRVALQEIELATNSDLETDRSTLTKEVRTLEVREGLLSKNDRFAQENRDRFQAQGLLVLNILSSPGAGKTSLIERMAKMQGDQASRVGVIVGDLATENDANRLRAAGATAMQITTGMACHLEADMVSHAVSHLDTNNLDLLVIENVGNLVCPAAYDLGETLRVVLLSVTEGEDKPLKYPTAFQSADVVLLSKIDIAEAVGFDRETAIANIKRMSPQAQLFEVSARTGEGMEAWSDYLRSMIN